MHYLKGLRPGTATVPLECRNCGVLHAISMPASHENCFSDFCFPWSGDFCVPRGYFRHRSVRGSGGMLAIFEHDFLKNFIDFDSIFDVFL